MAHTPGPWGVQRVKGSYLVPFHVLAEDGKPVAYCEGDQLRPDRTGIGEAGANARLIAAAPELLAALRGVLHWADCECKRLAEDTPANDDPPMCDYCVAKLVIAKAEGRSE